MQEAAKKDASDTECHLSPPPYMQHLQPKQGPSKKKFLASVILGVSIIIAITLILIVYIVLRSGPPQVFHVVVQNETIKIPLDVQINKKDMVEYFVSPFIGNSSAKIEILRDYKKGVTAHKDHDVGICYIGQLNPISIDERTSSLTKQTGLQLNGTQNYAVLNDTILPEILRFTVGDQIVSFCDPYPSMWMVPEEAIQAFQRTSRQKRTIGFGIFFGGLGHGHGYDHHGYDYHYQHHYHRWGYRSHCYPVCFLHCYSRCVSYYR